MTERWDYWNGPDAEDRRVKYAKDFKPEFQANGDEVQRRITALLTPFRAETSIDLPVGYSSGWRPLSINEKTANAGTASNHLRALAGDKRDTINGDFAWWCLRHQKLLEQHGLWMEHPVATVLRSYATAKKAGRDATPWCHLQTLPPHSGLRVYWPDGSSLTEWTAFTKAGGQPGASYAAWAGLQDGTKIA